MLVWQTSESGNIVMRSAGLCDVMCSFRLAAVRNSQYSLKVLFATVF